LDATWIVPGSNSLREGSREADNEVKVKEYVIPAVSETLNRSTSPLVSIVPIEAAPPIITTPVVRVEFG
jgi:hypothetical protein